MNWEVKETYPSETIDRSWVLFFTWNSDYLLRRRRIFRNKLIIWRKTYGNSSFIN